MKYNGRKTYPSYEVGYTFPKGWTCDTPLNVGNPTPIFRSAVRRYLQHATWSVVVQSADDKSCVFSPPVLCTFLSVYRAVTSHSRWELSAWPSPTWTWSFCFSPTVAFYSLPDPSGPNKTVLFLHKLLSKVLPVTTLYVCNSTILFHFMFVCCIYWVFM